MTSVRLCATAKLFRDRLARKSYLAIVFGHPQSDEWVVTEPLGKDPEDPKGFKEKVDVEGGKLSETRFRVLQRGRLTLKGRGGGAGPHTGPLAQFHQSTSFSPQLKPSCVPFVYL